MYDLFDPTELSDDELFSRMMRARHFLGVHISQGNDGLVHSIEMTLAVMEEEQIYRDLKKQEAVLQDTLKRKQKSESKRRKRNKIKEPKVVGDPNTITIGHIAGVDD